VNVLNDLLPSATLPGPNFLKKFDKTGFDRPCFKKHQIRETEQIYNPERD
jgi:hypothetical protein